MVGISLIDNVDEAFAAGNVNSFSLGVVEQVIGVTGNREVRCAFARGSVKNDQAGGLAAANEKPVIWLVHGHGKVRFEFCHRPRGSNGLLLTVDDGNLFGIGDVHENPAALLL